MNFRFNPRLTYVRPIAKIVHRILADACAFRMSERAISDNNNGDAGQKINYPRSISMTKLFIST